jgi:ribose/xylose/arabinose/galactoside ABC-type transport system permease subunit
MLTGGIDLSVGYVASMAGFVTATFVHQPGGWALGVAVALGVSALAGLVNGIGIGVFRVHPLIMTLGMGLIVLGFSNVWQLQSVQTGSGVPPELRTPGTHRLHFPALQLQSRLVAVFDEIVETRLAVLGDQTFRGFSFGHGGRDCTCVTIRACDRSRA